jgi:hypothetical protein
MFLFIFYVCYSSFTDISIRSIFDNSIQVWIIFLDFFVTKLKLRSTIFVTFFLKRKWFVVLL